MTVLKKGSNGNDVVILQKLLISLGYNVTADGDFGQKTDMAVKTFQQKHGLTVDGIVGTGTWSKLQSTTTVATGDILTETDYKKCADKLGVSVATVKAVKTVESGGKGLQNGIPTMLFEGHVFWAALKKKGIDPNKYVKGNENILYPTWVRTHYTGKNSGEFARLQKAIKIDEEAAYGSASYGLFQIMGNNFKSCGYKSAKEFYNAMCKGEATQLDAFTNFILNHNLHILLKQLNWAEFAKRYNGPGYAKNQYDIKLKKAYEKYK